MKKIFKIFVFIFIPIIFTNCASTVMEENLSYNSFDDDKFQFYFSNERPIVKIKINDLVLNFLVDTGANANFFIYKGIKKLLPYLPKEEFDTIKLSGGKIGTIKFIAEFDDKNTEYDGVLGIPFLSQKADVVSFDYKAKEILFLPMMVEGKEEPLIPVSVRGHAPLYFMTIQIENRKEFFLFDTGNEIIALRSNYDNEKSIYPSEDFIFNLLNNDYKKANRFKTVKLPTFYYGGNIYKDVRAVYNDFIFSKASISARRLLSSFSSAGYPLFKDKIVQIDFKKNTLIIAE